MNKEWVNRIGIIFNFLAGFMIAPELIGIERLKRIELNIEDTLLHLSKSLVQQFAYWRLKVREDLSDLSGILIATLTFLVPISILVGVLLLIHQYFLAICALVLFCSAFALLLWIANLRIADRMCDHQEYMYYTGQRTRLPEIPKHLVRFNPLSLLLLLLMPLQLLRLIIVVVFGGLVIVSLRGINKLISFLIRILDGQERLRATLVSTGIIVYILGNALQLISTF